MKWLSILALVVLWCACSCQAQCPQGSALNIGTCANPVTSLVITPPNPTVVAGQTAVLTATFQLQDGTLSNVASYQVTWSTSDATIATVSANSPVVTGVAAGTVTITATSNNDDTITGSTTLQVLASPAIKVPDTGSCTAPCALPNATNGIAYSFIFQAQGGTAPYIWTSSAGSPPTGITLSSGGVLSGTHNATDTDTWTVQVCDSTPVCTTWVFSLTTNGAASCGGPPSYCARTDTAVASGLTVNNGNPTASLIGLNGAGNCAFDDLNSGPASNSICRVTDYAMVQANLNSPATQWYSVDSSSTSRAWNCGANCSAAVNVFDVTDNGGATDFFSYVNSSPPVTALLGRAGHDSGANGGTKFASPDFSTTNPLLFYSGGTSTAQPRATFNSYLQDGTTGANSWTSSHITVNSVLLDPINCPGLTSYNTGPLGSTWNKYIANALADVSASTGASPVLVGDYRYVQDSGSLLVVYDPSVPGNHCRWLDLRSGTRGGDDMPTQAVTGFGPLPPPAAPAVSQTTGTLTCGHKFAVRITYTLIGGSTGNFTFGGESTPSAITLFTTTGSGSTCGLSVAAPVANPGGGTGINLTMSATGFNSYVCDRTLNSACNPILQQPSTAPAQPTISSVTGCTAGTTTYTFFLVAKNASTASVPSPGFTVNNVKDSLTGPINCTLNWTAVTGASTYDTTVDSMNVFTGSSTGTSLKVNLQVGQNTRANYALQTNPIASAETISTLLAGTSVPPTLNTAGPMMHNLRVDPSGRWMVISDTNAFSIYQPNPPKAPGTWIWDTHTANLIPCGRGALSFPYQSYCQAHWTHHAGIMISATQGAGIPGETAAVAKITFNDDVNVMNANVIFLGFPNGNLDTQSGDAHFSGNYEAGPFFRSAYPIANPYVLPNVPYSGEIDALDIVNTNKIYRFCHTWSSGAQGFESSPRGNVSQDGTAMIFESDMQRNGNGAQGTAAVGLGSFSGANTCTPGLTSPSANGCRYDVYVCQLR